MTTQELHIELDLLLQKVSSNWNSNFLPQEIDTFINREIYKYLKTHIFSDSNIKMVGIYDILKRVFDTNDCLVDIVVPLDNSIGQGRVKGLLPLDFFYYIEGTTDINCNNKGEERTITKHLITIADFSSIDISLQDIQTFKLVMSGSHNITLINSEDIPSNYFPVDDTPDLFRYFIYNNCILNTVIRALSLYPIQVQYNNITKRFEFYSPYPFNLQFIINEGEDNEIVIDSVNTVNIIPIYTVSDFSTAPIDIINEEFKTKIKNSTLSSSKTHIIKGYIRKDNVVLYQPEGFMLSNLTLAYIKKPLKVDVLLGYNSDIKDEVLMEIIHNVARTIKGIISSDTYEKFSRENMLIE